MDAQYFCQHYKIKGLASTNLLKFPLVWAVALSERRTRLTGPLSVRGSIHRGACRGAAARAQPMCRLSPIVTAGYIPERLYY